MVKPKVVCLCGSTRFHDEFVKANFEESLKGNIVLSVAFMPGVQEHGPSVGITKDQKILLDNVYKHKIALADEILVLNVGGYIGQSTLSEMQYATQLRKPIRFLEPVKNPDKLFRWERYVLTACHPDTWYNSFSLLGKYSDLDTAKQDFEDYKNQQLEDELYLVEVTSNKPIELITAQEVVSYIKDRLLDETPETYELPEEIEKNLLSDFEETLDRARACLDIDIFTVDDTTFKNGIILQYKK